MYRGTKIKLSCRKTNNEGGRLLHDVEERALGDPQLPSDRTVADVGVGGLQLFDRALDANELMVDIDLAAPHAPGQAAKIVFVTIANGPVIPFGLAGLDDFENVGHDQGPARISGSSFFTIF